MGKKKKVGKERIDKYYKLAKSAGYRARSAFKLIQIAQKYNIFKDANILIDLCAAPGGWLQVAYKNMKRSSTIIGVDLVPIRKIDNNVITLKCDITTSACVKQIKNIIKNEKADVILNDGAPNVGTTYSYDSFNQNVLVLNSIKIANLFLKKKGIFITKVFRNEEYVSLIWVMEKLFGQVKHIKPRSSREISSEIYLVGLNFLSTKVDKKLFDYNYVFSEQFKQDSNKIVTNDASDNDLFTDSSDNEKENQKKNKKKKGLSTILKEKKKKNRQGYEVGDDYRVTDICNFIHSDNYVDLLIKTNKFTFDRDYLTSEDPLVRNTYTAIYKNPSTTQEILQLCKDLKVLGKSDLFQLIKWRYKVKKGIASVDAEAQSSQAVDAEEKTSQELAPVKEDTPIKETQTSTTKASLQDDELSGSSDADSEKDEINEFSTQMEKKNKKEQKKKEKKLKKELEKRKMNKSFKPDYDENEIHFNKNMLKLLDKQSFEDHLNVLSGSKNNDRLEINQENDSSSEKEDNEELNDINESPMDRIEYLVNLDYEKQKMKEKKMNEEKSNEKLTRRKRAMDYKNEELMKIQKIMELKNEELMMKRKLHEYLSDDEDDTDDDDDDEEEGATDEGSDTSKGCPHPGKRGKGEMKNDEKNAYAEALKQNEHIHKMVDKIIRLRKDVKREEEKSNVNRFFDQKIFSTIFNEMDGELNDSGIVQEGPKGSGTPKGGDEDEDDNDGDDDDMDADTVDETGDEEKFNEVDERQLPKIPLPNKLARKERNKQLREKYGNNEVKMKNTTFSIVKTDEDGQSNVGAYFSNLIKDEDELAFIKCIGEKLIHKKSRMDLIDDSFNRHSYLDDEDMLPEWFVEEEKKFRRPVIPIDKSILNQYKSSINKITKMPIKKVIEAKMRNKKREIAKMKKLEAKIGKIEKEEEDPFLKHKAITNILKKNKSEKKREKSYVVCTGKGSKVSKKKNKKGGRTMVKYVDKRLKKDKKAKKRVEKKKKNISRRKYSKSRPFKFKQKN
ncbi:methyltransferase, putative [Plasmodium knowlesi strain H]|uniref:Putative rRNA methyltransferase n=3 Tax=Plasmodium knowlesi TaxID=5850 RepID=A0A5K1TUM4_PLAKH|nr:large subunit rRNA methyltransferase, putative [Plasmodium knowlesi strain H]OTN64729.1 putative rRNA methyltransferase [Plasmodium knowlesi]CAA9989003.1 large subunit rRNA methyltransferase, putative [Plasmodium knowlesi strain H]SBO24847.1 methyltransferase, putative [Plasmodium knowlesi strain H]SBO27573.1 methyltransferase, putative [Plasmodium knowlesi strain H]VVS78477.1 large subunit rRNA methyltransferase, putative [Plasmodium knowlesi strain H]|eukprot:XP_002261351.1 methyltransferase, putative [Plasmodium knowlesi strain H]